LTVFLCPEGMDMTESKRERSACPLYTIGVIEGRWKPMLYQRLAARPQGLSSQ
jgi:hypothetical protein